MLRNNNRGERREAKSKGYSLRMGQLFGPYSVGAIYPCDANTTVMIAGLDAYEDQVEKGRLEEVPWEMASAMVLFRHSGFQTGCTVRVAER